ncbi:4-hydroxy-tetrahydrodipicolinate reductase [Virgibacillus profundi]|uniref:4-hydroxy-tetrahydrodipicolinate reductase n=1 Tax=Virgibacillus profundi TaxID=2024555 RepID=A0A2A2ICL8_9BACI|nr:4-hydroxy-tetrahydrodipicolinate reductase [Virgibacillus profundi]PAV29479.1 4-hydroxy-tetrahydrodipicolinate reductase [Virgibacillus profundi]PXY53648.1 4-hydroxy-tetrahydrodipicolinate reductase [Virgibacillus profundi]
MTINVIIAGPRGKMGSEAIQMVHNEERFELVACIDRKNNGKQMKEVNSLPDLDVPIFENPEECFENIDADIFIDLTVPNAGFENTKVALNHNIRSVVGTTGFTDEQIHELSNTAKEQGIGCIIAPNFAVGAVLMMQFAQMAAKFFPDVEIIEKHHDNKLDAPSGTAIKTAELIKETRNNKSQGHPNEREIITGARGAEYDGMRIHSMRLPGLVAHQEVVFGASGQTLTIKHDSYNRESFMEGVKLAINEVFNLSELVYGLENILDIAHESRNKGLNE